MLEPNAMPEPSSRPLEFGWYLPTHGDTTVFNDPAAEIPPSLELFERVVAAAENAEFEYLLIPVGVTCWEAYMAGAYMAARSSRIRPLIAARPGYINPVMLAKMISTLDHLSRGRIAVNLIAGQNEADVEAEGVTLGKAERYDLMAEEVDILKALWTAEGPIDFDGRFHKLKAAARRRHGTSRPAIRTCICSGATRPSASRRTSRTSAHGPPTMTVPAKSDSECGSRSFAARKKTRPGARPRRSSRQQQTRTANASFNGL
jgi:alkanesulfonate monooxygenase